MSKIKAPWTPKQVAALNAWQADAGIVHPYTCGADDCSANLVATVHGWICPLCVHPKQTYQDWAHEVSLTHTAEPFGVLGRIMTDIQYLQRSTSPEKYEQFLETICKQLNVDSNTTFPSEKT